MLNRIRNARTKDAALSLLEVLAIITIVGVLAAIVIPRFVGHSEEAKRGACHAIRGNLEVQAQLWYRHKGTWPGANLSDMAADADYLPDGLPTCPVDGSNYQFDSTTQTIIGHDH